MAPLQRLFLKCAGWEDPAQADRGENELHGRETCMRPCDLSLRAGSVRVNAVGADWFRGPTATYKKRLSDCWR